MAPIDSTLRAVLQKRREFAPNATFPVVVTPARGAGSSVRNELERVAGAVALDEEGNFILELSIPDISRFAESELPGQMRMRRIHRAVSAV